MKPSVYWAIGFLLYHLSSVGCQVDIGIVVTPDRNQTVPFASDENITYSCSVDGGRSAIWEVRGSQIIGQGQASLFAESGFFVEGLGASTSVIRISGEARRNASQDDPPGINLICVAMQLLTGTPGRKYFIITYDPPISPRGLNLVLIGSPTPTLRLVWERPLNVDPQVDIIYTVEINSTLPSGMNYGPFENITQTFLPIDFPEALHSNRSCQMYHFYVRARNGAGTSLPSRYLETLPISTNVTNINQTLRVSSVDLQDGRGVAVTVSFKSLEPCSENFPIENYTINVNNSRGFPLPPSTLPPPGNTITRVITDRDIPLLQRDMVYSLSVIACSNFSCKQSKSLLFSTSDLQSAQVIFYENNIYLSCILARNSPALGCSVELTLATNTDDTQPDATFDLLRTKMPSNIDNVILSNCTMLTNRKEAYDEERIVGVAIREDNMPVGVVIRVMVSEEGSADNFTRLTNCTLPQQGINDNRTVTIVLAVVLPILFVSLLVAPALIAVFVYLYLRQKRKYKKRPSVTTDHVDNDTVVCDIKFRDDEFAKLLKPEGTQVRRSSSAPVNVQLTTTAGSAGSNNTPSTSSSSHSDETFRDQGQPPSRDRNTGRVPYMRSVSDNYKVIHNPYEVELNKSSVRLRFHRPGLRQYSAAKRSMSEGGSASGSALCLKISEELQSLLSEDNLNANLDTVDEEPEATSPAGDNGETGSLLGPPGRSDSGNKSNHSLSSPGIIFKAKKHSDDGSITIM